ncbi:MAG: hypothetical protein E6199_05350, partial [Mixta calida]|nr:hypothetical protein [Mixta calida]
MFSALSVNAIAWRPASRNAANRKASRKFLVQTMQGSASYAAFFPEKKKNRSVTAQTLHGGGKPCILCRKQTPLFYT